jgi:hypothetical protein
VLLIRAHSGTCGKARIWELAKLNRSMEVINSLCYLIHNIPLSILDEEFTKNDINFINHAISSFLDDSCCSDLTHIRELLIEFYHACPENKKSQLKWHPEIEN